MNTGTSTDNVQLYHDDCFNIFPLIKDSSVDLILADLPYGTTKCKWDVILPFEELWKQYFRILSPNGNIVLFATQPFTSKLIMSNPKKFRECITWIKHRASNFGNAKKMHLKYTEDIVVFGGTKRTFNPQMQPRKSSRIREGQKGNSKNWNTQRHNTKEVSFSSSYKPREWSVYSADFKFPPNYIEIPAVVSNSKEKVDHPTQKPIRLLDYLIKTYSNEGDLVLDNTMGSGSTGVAAKINNRKFIGIEKDEKYFKIAYERIFGELL
ncbi:MAG: site-specific DNA-methyltransferase [Bacteroidales bacterium]